MNTRNRSADVVIVGAGLAGAATAFFLAQRGIRDIVTLEKEPAPGIHASGQNAAMVRQVVPDPEVAALARAGADFIRRWSREQTVSYAQNGSLLLAEGLVWEGLRRDAELAQRAGTPAEYITPSEARRRVPILGEAKCDGAVWCASDGVVDVVAMLETFLIEAQHGGAQLRTNCLVKGLEAHSGRITAVLTEEGPLYTDVVVNAAGAWAGELGRLAGAVPLTPYRRHLFMTAPLEWTLPTWPFVWDLSHDYYFRPESGGLLLCPCDETAWPPEIPPVDPTVIEQLAERVACHLPMLATAQIQRSWAGLRTFASDRRFVIGWDPMMSGFFWVAALGGHGVTASASVGQLAAELILAGRRRSHGVFDPARFL